MIIAPLGNKYLCERIRDKISHDKMPRYKIYPYKIPQDIIPPYKIPQDIIPESEKRDKISP